jgi:predicted aspartyl protease
MDHGYRGRAKIARADFAAVFRTRRLSHLSSQRRSAVIVGRVNNDGVPEITIAIGNNDWPTIVDTGFNGDLELPTTLFNSLDAEYVGPLMSSLAGGQTIVEDCYQVQIPFDGEVVTAQATFVDARSILLGTRLIQGYVLTVDFPKRGVLLKRAPEAAESPQSSE